MQTTAQFIEMLKAKHGLKSNYAVAKYLGKTDTDVARWMKGKNTLGDDAAMQVADLLELDPAYVVACMHAERAKHEAERKLWERIASMAVAATVLLVIGGVSIGGLSSDTLPLLTAQTSGALYIMTNGNAAYWASFAALFVLLLWARPRHNPRKNKPDSLAK